MFERLAEWYLQRCGKFIIPYTFVGIAFGYAEAVEAPPGVWTVIVPQHSRIISVNHSIVIPFPKGETK